MSRTTDEMADAGLRIARRIARATVRRTGTDPDAVESDACLGAAKAVAAWNPKRFYSFEAFATSCIKNTISTGFRTRVGRYKRRRRALNVADGREILSIGTRDDFDDGWASFQRWRGREPEKSVDWKLIDEVWALVDALPREQRMAMRFAYFFGWYDREVGEYFGMSETWAWHQRRAGIARIKAHYWGEELTQ